MNNIKVAAAALNQIPLDWEGNYKRICEAIDLAYKQNVSILCLPELCITGYSLEDLFFAKEVHKKSLEYLHKIINHLYSLSVRNSSIAVSVGLPYFIDGALYNVAALINSKGVLGFVPKQNLANDGVHYESRWFKPGLQNLNWLTDSGDHFGDMIFDFDGIRVGFEICEDLWVANRPGIALAQRAVDIILNPSASHFAFGKHKIRETMIVDSSRAFKCTYIYSNLLGNEAGRVIFEGDTFISSAGKLVASGPRLSFKDIILTTAVIDTDLTKTQQVMNGSFHPTKDEYFMITSHMYLKNINESEIDNQLLAEDLNKYDEFIFAESLGLFDYMRKSHSQGYTVSLSGGADSAVCACLIKYMHDRGIMQLGREEFIIKSGLKVNCFDGNLMYKLLTCVYQSTKNSSEDTFNAAKTVAEGIKANFINWDVNAIMHQYIELAEKAIDRNLTWENDDITLQNIQARIRIPGIWMLANINQSLLICTSNRSESAVGYCTADGDLSGSLSPLAGIDKEFLLDWLYYTFNMYSDPGSPNYYGNRFWTTCIELIIRQKPTAELRPLELQQSDEKDLMSYDILQEIEHMAIVEKKFPQEVFESLMSKYLDYTHMQLQEYVNKFFKLWVRNQWKKDKMPIGFMLDDECLDPKTWCRFPTLCSNFEEI